MVKAIVGANWGDEGKGKITDLFASESDIVIRFQGGANAGHTIINDYGRFALHLLPSGVCYQHTMNIIGNGVALDIPKLIAEIKSVTDNGVPAPHIMVSDRAQVMMPYHVLLDTYEEERLADKQFGSTKSGIAPFYSDKYAKIGFQVNELFDEEYLKENNIDYCTDETNLEDHYTRNRLRNHVIPYLEREINPRAVSHMADTMEQMRTVWAFMEEEVEKCRKYCVKPKQDKADGVVILEEGFRSVNETVRTFLIHELLCETAGRKKDIEQIHVKLVEELMEHQTGRKIMLPYEMTGERCYEGIWLHKVKDKEKSGENSKPPVQMRILERTPQTSVFPKKTYTKWFDYDIIKSTVKIRHKQPGDYITIDKNGSTQSLKKYFVNVKVPREDREKIWLAADGSHILWIIGYRQNQAYQVTDKTRRILEIEFNGGEEDGRESKSISS